MIIEYFGHSCFRLTAENGVRVVTDPFTRIGYELPDNLQSDIVTVSHGHYDHNYIDGVSKYLEIWNMAGEYSYSTIKAKAFLCNHDEKGGTLRGKNLIFIFEVDGLRVCHLGDIGEAYRLEFLEKIGEVDVLLIPIGGTYTIDTDEAKVFIDALQPKIVIPMHYRPKDGTVDITDATKFLASFADCTQRVCPKNRWTIDKEMVLQNKPQIIYMEKE